jgi:hypothetical protein
VSKCKASHAPCNLPACSSYLLQTDLCSLAEIAQSLVECFLVELFVASKINILPRQTGIMLNGVVLIQVVEVECAASRIRRECQTSVCERGRSLCRDIETYIQLANEQLNSKIASITR